MNIKELKKEFNNYLTEEFGLSKASVASTSAMAFFAYKHNIGFDFYNALIDDTKYIEAKSMLNEHLLSQAKTSNEINNVRKYLLAFDKLKAFVDTQRKDEILEIASKISIEEETYNAAKNVYLKKMDIPTASNNLNKIDSTTKAETFSLQLYAFLSMMDGVPLTRSITYMLMETFIRNISRDFGPEKRRNALMSVKTYLDDYYRNTGNPLKEHRRICQKISDEFEDGFTFLF